MKYCIPNSGGSGSAKGERTHALEQNIFKLQEELLSIHSKKNENSQQIIDLNNAVQEKDKELAEKDIRYFIIFTVDNNHVLILYINIHGVMNEHISYLYVNNTHIITNILIYPGFRTYKK